MKATIAGLARIAAIAIVAAGMSAATSSGPAGGPVAERAARPYADDSPWNLPIGPNPAYDPLSDEFIAAITGPFGCDPTQYAYTVYQAGDAPVPVQLSGVYSEVTDGGTALRIRKRIPVEVPVPQSAVPSRGRDAQVIILDPVTGDEWGFWKFARSADGSVTARNGYHYNVHWSGVPPIGFNSRGAGVPYLAGLVRPVEIRRGRIDHALAFGCRSPAGLFVFPATKSDGSAGFPALPEGARLQLDPTLTDRDFAAWGLDEAGKTMARALQEYGMILVDGSGHPKIYVEDIRTADWGGLLDKNTVKPIPYSAFRVLRLTAPARPVPPAGVEAQHEDGTVVLRWKPSHTATRYRVSRREEEELVICEPWVTETRFMDGNPAGEPPWEYAVHAVSHNGVSEPAIVRLTPGS